MTPQWQWRPMHERAMEGTVDQDSGAEIRDVAQWAAPYYEARSPKSRERTVRVTAP